MLSAGWGVRSVKKVVSCDLFFCEALQADVSLAKLQYCQANKILKQEHCLSENKQRTSIIDLMPHSVIGRIK